jgi:hypothetical protein
MIQAFIYAITAVGLAIWLIIASKGKSKWGVNLKRVHCPICRAKQPIVRMPKSGSQALWGGTTCAKCNTNLDKYGNIIS